jgi:hypothetical protein
MNTYTAKAGYATRTTPTIHVSRVWNRTDEQGVYAETAPTECVRNQSGNSIMKGLARTVNKFYTFGEAETPREALAKAIEAKPAAKVCKVCAKAVGYTEGVTA